MSATTRPVSYLIRGAKKASTSLQVIGALCDVAAIVEPDSSYGKAALAEIFAAIRAELQKVAVALAKPSKLGSPYGKLFLDILGKVAGPILASVIVAGPIAAKPAGKPRKPVAKAITKKGSKQPKSGRAPAKPRGTRKGAIDAVLLGSHEEVMKHLGPPPKKKRRPAAR